MTKKKAKPPVLKVFTPRPPEVKINEAWINILEGALERAKSGEAQGGVLIEEGDDSATHALAGIKSRWSFIGHLQKIIHMLLE